MNSELRTVHLRLMDSAKPPVVAQVRVVALSRLVRLRRAALRCLAFWGVGVLFLPVPAVHFCLVPGFLVAGPIFGWKRWQQRVLLEPGVVPCPRCVAQPQVREGTSGWPAALHCAACGATFDATPPEQ